MIGQHNVILSYYFINYKNIKFVGIFEKLNNNSTFLKDLAFTLRGVILTNPFTKMNNTCKG